MNSSMKWLVMFGALLLKSNSASAQTDTTKFVCYFPIEPMPELPGGGGNRAIVTAIQKRIVYPAKALQAGAEGKVFASFAVTPSGKVQNITVLKTFRSDCGVATVNAIRQLPLFKPRRKDLGTISLTVPITFKIKYDLPPANAHHPALHKVTPLRNPNP